MMFLDIFSVTIYLKLLNLSFDDVEIITTLNLTFLISLIFSKKKYLLEELSSGFNFFDRIFLMFGSTKKILEFLIKLID